MSNMAAMMSRERIAKQILDAVTKKVLYGIIENGPVGQAFQRLGLVVVPKEPTAAMLKAGLEAAVLERDHLADEGVPEIWCAMVEASQAEQRAVYLNPAKEQGEEEAEKEHGHGETP